MRSRKGLTLVEVMLAIAFLVLGLLGTLAALTSCVTLNTLTSHRSAASHAVREKIEEIKSASVIDMVDLYHNQKFVVPELSRTSTDSAGLVTVDDTVAARPTITVRVAWVSVIGKPESYELSTIITDF